MWTLDLNFAAQLNPSQSLTEVKDEPVWRRVLPRWNPGPLSHCSVCVNAKKAYVVGGVKNTGESNSKLFVFDSLNEQWELPKIKGTPPGAIDEHTSVMREDGKMYVFGGYSDRGELSNDLFCFNVNTSTWQAVEAEPVSRPPPRAGHSACIIKTKMFVFGGKGPDCLKYNDTWIFDTKNLLWSQVNVKEDIDSLPPLARSGHSMLTYRGKLVVFGGMQQVLQEMSDLSLFDPRYRSWTQLIQSEKRQFAQVDSSVYGASPLRRTQHLSHKIKETSPGPMNRTEASPASSKHFVYSNMSI